MYGKQEKIFLNHIQNVECGILGLLFTINLTEGDLHFSIVAQEIGTGIKNAKDLINNSRYNNYISYGQTDLNLGK